MGKVLLTLYYHPDEKHATTVCKKLEGENFDGSIVPYIFSSPNHDAPDRRLKQKAVECDCDHILTIHSDPRLEPLNYALVLFSDRVNIYKSPLKQLQQKFDAGTYGFQRPSTKPIQIDLELSEQNNPELSVNIVKGVLALLSNL